MRSIADMAREIDAECRDDPVYFGEKYFQGYVTCVLISAAIRKQSFNPANYSRWRALKKLTVGYVKMVRTVWKIKSLPKV